MTLDRRYVVTPVHKSMQLLDALVASKGPMTLSDLASCTALPKTTAFRYLYTLRASGFVGFDERTERYVIGPRVAVSRPLPAYAERIREIAQPAMLRLQRQFNETVNLAVADGADIVYVAMVGSTRSLRMEASLGARDPLHSTSLGKAILATRPIESRLEALPKRLLARTPKTITSRRSLDLELESAAARGFALDIEENELGAHCVAAAIPATNPPAAISISGPAQRLPDDALPRIGASLTFYGMAVVRQFEMLGCYCLARADAIGLARDKLLAHQTLARHRVPTPPTAFAHSPKDTRHVIDLVGGAPIVLKLLASTQGKGVVLAETRKAAESIVSAFRDLDAYFLVQDFIEEAAGADIRCIVIGGKVVAAMQRQAAEGEFRANLHQGGQAKAVRLTKEERRMAIKAAQLIGLGVAGVDLLRAKDGPKVLEVNASPGLEGIEKASGKDIAGAIIDHVAANVSSLVHMHPLDEAEPIDTDAGGGDDLP